MDSYRLIYLTAADEAAARALAGWIVEQRLAACAHIMPAGQSFYWWQGELVEQAEMVVIAKTRADLAEMAIARIADRHDYEIPCVLSLPIEAGHAPFLEWINQQTTAK